MVSRGGQTHTRPRKPRRGLSDQNYVLMLLLPAAIFIGIFMLYPLGILVYNSFQHIKLTNPDSSTFAGLQNYLELFSSSRVRTSVGRTLQYTAVTLLAEFLLGFTSALLFSFLGRKSDLMRTVFLFPLMISPLVGGILWRFMLIDNFGIVNWVLYWMHLIKTPNDINWLSSPDLAIYSVTLPDVWLTTCFVSMILYAGLQNIPVELKEAANIDGASPLQVFMHIILPLLRPVIAVVLILRGIDAARTFDIIWVMTGGGPQFSTDVLSLQIYREMVRYGDLGSSSATATLFLVGLLIASLTLFFSIWKPGKH
ncbi:carbohydrate ABC transporter permease [Deinococcus roseus]|uniref:Sugar ABC transporter permease n=1 Tax=Deinococcus roseus TaxID=392414 RepID=A0ABQ2D2T4_9DEIO|nr:sugar ABC transporter permease [Deinococcus roseus]GGJ43559.1 sugar ABC transporter permease [Deinococcus roseus]